MHERSLQKRYGHYYRIVHRQCSHVIEHVLLIGEALARLGKGKFILMTGESIQIVTIPVS